MDPRSVNKCRAIIGKSFPDIRPGNLHLPVGGSCDPEFMAIDTYFNKQKWTEVTLNSMIEAVDDINSVAPAMHERAFAYYLPALLLAGMRPEWQASAVMEGVLDRLADLAQSSLLRTNLTEKQRAAVVEVLNLYSVENPMMREWVEKAMMKLS